jgi:hypothetical protein
LPAATICRARDEIEMAVALIEREGEQHARLMFIGRSIEAEILEIEYAGTSGASHG